MAAARKNHAQITPSGGSQVLEAHVGTYPVVVGRCSKMKGATKKKACQGHGGSDGMMPAIVRRLSSVYLMEKTRGRRRSAGARKDRPPADDEELGIGS